MRELTPEWTAALAAEGITTAYVFRLDFLNEPVFAWTGVGALEMAAGATGDLLLDGHTYDPLAAGVPLSFSDNVMSYSGSDAFTVTLAVPVNANPEILAATYLPAEFQARPATIWRAMMVSRPGAITPAVWSFRRIRSGNMDKVRKSNTGEIITFELTIESHASFASAASQSTYLDQKNKFDPTDTSQDYAVAIANGTDLSPAKLKGFAGMAQNFRDRPSFDL